MEYAPAKLDGHTPFSFAQDGANLLAGPEIELTTHRTALENGFSPYIWMINW